MYPDYPSPDFDELMDDYQTGLKYAFDILRKQLVPSLNELYITGAALEEFYEDYPGAYKAIKTSREFYDSATTMMYKLAEILGVEPYEKTKRTKDSL